ncbi:hypothetical protein L596_012960 [Steinernema carpocapsae]|uniref:G-protein coupled receptors family 1 profile domain-containing protein n=1 Tax=Steinernema carpocapsae TaxID=34508 RepID=A0A4U5NYM8_STECR|nr:hypothetical protein L596_012960 [Steinernema carpocapsae]
MSPLRLALLLLLVGLPLFVLADFHLFERSCRRAKKEDDGCFCVMHVSMSKCCCVGRQVKEIPTFRENLKFLFLHDVSLTNISATQFDNYTSLVELVISDSALEEVNAAAFDNLKSLMKISITNCPRLTTFNGTLLRTTPRLQSVVVKYTGLERSPSFEMLPDSGSRTVDVIDFSHNRLEYLESGLMKNVKAKTVRFNDNNLQAVGEDVFQDCQFVSLYLNDNEELSDISPDVFRNILEIQNLNMSNTAITILPTNGLTDKIQTLTLIKTHDLKVMPQVLTLTELHIAQFTYPYHCCLFKYASRILTNAFMDNKKIVVRQDCVRRFVGDKKMLRKRAIEAAVTTQASRKARNGDEDAFLNNLADWLKLELQEFQENSEENDTISDSGALDPVEFDTFADLPVGSVQVLAECESEIFEFDWTVNVTCTPQGDELNPCEDLVGYFWLRWVIWIMWTVGVVMNIVVLCFLWNIKQRNLRLHYFFMMNLSFADLLTGIYLAMLAIMDIRSSSQYYNYALDWQTGWGCWIAGFLSVLASELSIISMFLLAFEMWYNAKYAFFGKKMGPKLAYGLMFGGYIFSFTMAIGPWFGVSSYETSSICLPLSIDSIVDQAYLVVGLVFNSVAFIGVIMCYIMISFMLCNPNTPSRDEDTHIIAKMAILIGTDMACWMPTLFFGLTAALNHPLISLTNAKVFLIVFYPINSLCNPVLYCLATKVAKNKVQTKIKKFKQLQIHRSSVDWLKSFGSEKHLPKLNHFYHSNPPSERSSIPNGYDPSAKLLFITNPNSPDHTPRGSAGSITPTPRSPNPDDQEEFMPPKRNSIVSFQETVLVHSDNSMFTKRKSMGSIRQKVSAIPEMSDISENISENSAVSQPNAFPDEVYFPKRKAPRRASLQLVSKFIRSRRSKNRSIGADSGRGSSVTSTSSLLNVPFQKERVSLTSADSCFTDDRGSFELTSFGSGSGSDTSSSSPLKIRNTKTPSLVITDHSREDDSILLK